MLHDLTVLDLSRVLAGPYCTQLLADLGATVWKLEPPGGEDTRRWGPPFAGGESSYYLSVNRGKKSLAVNLKDTRGREIARELARRADVLVENFKVGDLVRYDLDYESLQEINPALIYASITGFGQTGPRAHELGYDAALQALSGLMSMTGEPGREPVKLGVAWIDVLSGLHTAVAILAALHERKRSGLGQHLDLSLFEVSLASLVNQVQSTLLTGDAPEPLGSAHPSIVPYQAFVASDAHLVIAVGNDDQFARLCGVLELPELSGDPRFRANEGRVEHRRLLIPRLQGVLALRPRQEWLALLRAAGVPATPVNTLSETFGDPQVAARGMITSLLHPTIGNLPMVASPLRHTSRTPPADVSPPPLLGQHTREVLTAVLGIKGEDVTVLEQSGVVFCRQE
jgi:crotonobetainyl-CoA:carnitine CoA-transferase CaiB-like acyl-CoA transferase